MVLPTLYAADDFGRYEPAAIEAWAKRLLDGLNDGELRAEELADGYSSAGLSDDGSYLYLGSGTDTTGRGFEVRFVREVVWRRE